MPPVEFRDDACVSVVLASEGYPVTTRTGEVITGIDAAESSDVVVFHAGTARRAEGALVTAGGRVLDVTATGASVADARQRAYDAAAKISWPGMHYRHDIAGRAE
jgi:phosphoribosylamine--glycine ligase